MALHNKRTYTAQLEGSEAIGAGNTLVPALIRNITMGTTKKNTPYWRVSVFCMSKEPVFIQRRAKKKDGDENDKKKQKTEGGDDGSGEGAMEVVDGMEDIPKGTTIKPGEQFMCTTYDRAIANLDQGHLVKLALTTDWYIDHFTFQASRVLVDDKHVNALTRKVYEKCVTGTALAEIPTKYNFSPDDFPPGTDEKYISRTFILPLSMGLGTDLYNNVEIQIDPRDKTRFHCLMKQDPNQYIGVNHDIGADTPANMLKVVYTLNNEFNTKVMMTLAYKPDVWKCFGMQSIDEWKNVGGRMLFYAVDWLVYGYSQHSKIMAIKDNMEGSDDIFDDDDGTEEEKEQFLYSTAFVAKMNVNMPDTIRACGIPLSFDYIEKHYGGESGYESEKEYPNHPFNVNWRLPMRRGKSFIITLTDMSTEQLISFFKEYKAIDPKKNTIEFYGIFSVDSDEPYEIQTKTPEEREEQLIAKGFKPVMVYAINK